MNFFKKHWIVILIITLLCISAIIGIFEGIQEYKQEQKTSSNYHEELEKNFYSQENKTITINQLSNKVELIKKSIQEKPVFKYNWRNSNYNHEQLTSQIIKIEKDIEIIQTKPKNFLYEYFKLPLWAQTTNLDPLPICISLLKSQIDKIEGIINQIKPKIQITQEKYDKIKSYILSENKNEVLSLNDLSEEEKTEIEKIKQDLINNMKDSENGLKSEIDKYQKKCDDYNKKISQLNPQDEFDKIKQKFLTEQLQGAERLKKDLIEGLNSLFTQDKQFALSDLNSLYEINPNEG
ncbi:MAG: hypothetical protein WJU30_00099 [Candidatus Phytoplasma pruni]